MAFRNTYSFVGSRRSSSLSPSSDPFAHNLLPILVGQSGDGEAEESESAEGGAALPGVALGRAVHLLPSQAPLPLRQPLRELGPRPGLHRSFRARCRFAK